MSDTSAYYGQSSWSPSNTWTLSANTVTQLSHDNFVSTISQDPDTASAIGDAIMQSDGALRCPYPSTYLLNVGMNLADFCNITLPDNQVPSMIIQFKYIPASSASPSVQPFVMGTVALNKANSWAQMAQRTAMTTGDSIQILITSTIALNNVQVGNQSQIFYNDDISNVSLQLYAGISGQPPAYNVNNKVSFMQTAPIIDSKAVFTLTQDGTNGKSLFETGISFFTVSTQSLTPITDIAQPSQSFDPIPSDLKSATVHFSKNGGKVPDNTYVAAARFDGW